MTVVVITPAVDAVPPETLIIIVHPIQAVDVVHHEALVADVVIQEILNAAAVVIVRLTAAVHRYLTIVVPLIPVVTARASMCL